MKTKISSLTILLCTIFAAPVSASTYNLGFAAPALNDKDAVASPETGAIVFDTTLGKFFGFNGASWDQITSAANSPVNARYKTSTTQSIANNTITIINFSTVDYDTDSAVTTGASWHFTAPSTGKYHVSAISRLTASMGANVATLYIYKNGSEVARATFQQANDSTNWSKNPTINDTIALSAGDTLDVRIGHNSGSTLTLTGTSEENRIAIDRVGD